MTKVSSTYDDLQMFTNSILVEQQLAPQVFPRAPGVDLHLPGPDPCLEWQPGWSLENL